MELRVRRLRADASLPTRAHPGDAGLDLRAAESAELAPGARASIATGIAIAVPDGHAGLVLPRSGLAAEHGIALVNSPGLIDSGYRGEVRVLVLNTDRGRPFTIRAGERIAQLLVTRYEPVEPVEANELAASARGSDGFGSTGR